MDKEFREKLRRVFSESLEVPSEIVTDTFAYSEVKQWDSVAHMSLIAAIEQDFDIFIDTDDVIAMSSFAKACEIVLKYRDQA